jgi:hypothetical protein
MSAGVAARVALLAVAVAATAWLGFGLRALELQADGQEEGRRAGNPPRGPRLEAALDLLRRAGERNPDPRPQLDEASLLLAAGDSRGAAHLLEGIVDRNPGTIRGWGLLATATAPFDERRSLQANGELLKLYGRIPGQLGGGVVRSTSGRRYRIAPGQARGVVDRVVRRGRRVVFSGWAGLPGAGRPAQEVLVVAHGRVVGASPPTVDRPDVRLDFGEGRIGFRVAVAESALRNRAGEVDAHVLGAGLGASSQLPVDCRRSQVAGC